MDKSNMKNFLINHLQQLKNLKENHNHRIIRVELGKDVSISPENFIYIDSIRLNSHEKIKESFLLGYLAKSKTFEFIEKDFNELYEELILLEQKGKYVFRTIGYIPELKIGKEIEIDGIKLVPANNKYVEFIINTYDEFRLMYSYHSGINMTKFKNIYDGTFISIEQFAPNRDELKLDRNKIENVLKAIIMIEGTNKVFSVTPFYTFSYLYERANVIRYNYFSEYTSQKRFDGVSKVQNIDDIESLYFKIKNSTEPDFIAIKRIISAFQKSNLEDKYLDLMIALESLYLSVQTEVTFRISLYTSILIGGSLDTYKNIKKLYGLRSGIAHGSSKKKLTNDDYIILDDIVRKAVAKAIDILSSSKDTNLNKLEEEILNDIFKKKDSTIL